MSATLLLLTSLTLAQGEARPTVSAPTPAARAPAAPAAEAFVPDPDWKPLGHDVWFDPKARRVVVRARVCLIEGALEHLLCSKATKEHESILATEAPPKAIHTALVLTGIEPGHPVRFEPKFEPPAGPAIAIEVEWEQKGQTKKADARDWIKDSASGAKLAHDWVFAGSVLFPDRRTKQMVYAADDGDLFTVANFASAILDLPYRSSANDADRSYVANTEKIPPRGTAVTIYLAPRPNPPVAPRP